MMTYSYTVTRSFLSVGFRFQRRVFLQTSRTIQNQELNQIFENRIKNQESIDWIRNRLNCKELYWRKTGRPIFKFKNYLVSYIHSIDPNFQANDIDEVLYDGGVSDCAAALIYTNKSEAADKIERILQDRNVSEMFPGFKHLIS